MRYSTCVGLACALFSSARTLTAQSAPRPTVAAVAGCYTLTLGPWQEQAARAVGSPQILPSVIRLDTALAARATGWRQLGPTTPYFSQFGREIGPAWRVSQTDSVEAFWSTGFVGTQLTLALQGDSLIGGAKGFTDARGGTPDPTTTARAVRVTCPAELP